MKKFRADEAVDASGKRRAIAIVGLVIALLVIIFMIVGLIRRYPGPNQGQKVPASIAGRAQVLEGDLIAVQGIAIRLEGIDAPEMDQTCTANGQTWPCGAFSASSLRQRLGEKIVTCRIVGADVRRMPLAKCLVDGIDIQDWLVSNGWALAFRRYSTEYVDAEARASAEHLGIWRGAFVMPWEWRQHEDK